MVAELVHEGDTEMRFKSGLRYRSLGRFFEAAIKRRDLTLDDVSKKTGLSVGILEELVRDERKFDQGVVRKLRPVFPATYRSFAKLQGEIDQMNPQVIARMSKTGSPTKRFG